MIITFVHHSCFVAETEEKVLVFDYFENGKVKGYHFTGVLPEFDPNKQVYVFASHFHQDHFDPAVLKVCEDSLRFIKGYQTVRPLLGEKRHFAFRKGEDYVCNPWETVSD